MNTSTTTEMIKNWQRKRVYGLANELGMTTTSKDKNDDLHSLLFDLTGEASFKNLSSADAESLINELEHRNRRFPEETVPVKKSPSLKPSPGGVTEGQQRKIIALMCEMRKVDKVPSSATIEQRVAGIITKELGITSTAINPYAWLKYKDGSKLIEIIKGYLVTARRKAQARGEPDEQ